MPTARSVEEHSRITRNEFPENYDTMPEESSGVSRRTFMGLLSASMAVAATACRRPDHKFVPAVRGVEYQIPGLPNYYTTVHTHGNAATGLLVTTREGRPIKIEGNDLHPASMGSSSGYQQAAMLTLYDPDRMKRARINNGYSSVDNAFTAIAQAIKDAEAEGKGSRILIEEHASPSLAAMIQQMQAAIPSLQVVVMPAIGFNNAAAVNSAVLGINAELVPNYAQADVILSVDEDFLSPVAKHAVYNVRSFAKNRRPSRENPTMSKLIVAESTFSVTGSNADTRVRVAPNEYEAFLGAVLNSLGGGVALRATASGELAAAAKRAASELKAGKQGMVVVGAHLPQAVHALGIAINQALNAFGEGKPLNPAHQLPFSGDATASLQALRSDLENNTVGAVVFVDTNPMYSADKKLRGLLQKVKHRFAISLYDDETAATCSVYIPLAHYLESWGDAVSFDGTRSVQQPMIAPLNTASVSIGEAFMRLTKKFDESAFGEMETYFEYVQERWTSSGESAPTNGESAPTSGEEAAVVAAPTESASWDSVLRDGVLKGSLAPASMVYNAAEVSRIVAESSSVPNRGGDAVHCFVTPSYALYDGKFANNGWLQELADPVTKITWENVALMSRATAGKYGVTDGDIIQLATDHGSISVPVWIQPGMAEGVIATAVGYGRTTGGVVFTGAGSNAYELLAPQAGLGYVVATVTKTGENTKIATTQNHHMLMGREIVKETTLGVIKSGEEELFHRVHVPGRAEGDKGTRFSPPTNIMDDFQYKGHRWAMSIDMSSCTGCNACIIACQSENNIPVVGKQEVINGREMQWIRLDRYYVGSDIAKVDDDNVEVVYQPMLCQHCENAPCENVCPVAATTHSPEGLNEMTYNRCVGTRYCLNNCPYKVRRFNYLNWHKGQKTPTEFVFNPDVTVRMRGVMEKCTFCVQRINQGKYKAKDEGRSRVHDGEVITACQQACPAEAIVFGDVNDAKSKIHQLSKGERGFLVLEEINTRPQITYQAKVRNNAPVGA